MAFKSIIYLLVFTFANFAFGAELGLPPKRMLLSIGLGNFEFDTWHKLKFAAKDAEDIYDYFRNQGFENARLLTDEKTAVTSAEVMNQLDIAASALTREEDIFILYISTHGTVAFKADGSIGRFVIMSDTDPKNIKQTSIDYDVLIKRFQQLKSRKKVLILAFCHSGIGKSILTSEMKKSLLQLKSPYFEEPIHTNSEGSIILTASGWREPALEDEKLRNDVYTHFLLKGFGEDANNDGIVSITEAHSYASRATYEYTRGRQRPSAIIELLGADPIIISGDSRRKPRGTMIFPIIDHFTRFKIMINGKDYGLLQKGIEVPEGTAHIVIKDEESDQTLTNRKVSLRAGHEYFVTSFLGRNFYSSLGIGVQAQRFLDEGIVRDIAPNPMFGLSLRHDQSNVWGMDAIISQFTYFPQIFEDIGNYQTLGVITQKRSMWSVSINGAYKSPVASLSDYSGDFQTDGYLTFGLNALLMKRQVLNLDDNKGIDSNHPAFEDPKAAIMKLGCGAAAGLETSLISSKLKAGFELRLDFIRNPSTTNRLYIASTAGTLSVGTAW